MGAQRKVLENKEHLRGETRGETSRRHTEDPERKGEEHTEPAKDAVQGENSSPGGN